MAAASPRKVRRCGLRWRWRQRHWLRGVNQRPNRLRLGGSLRAMRAWRFRDAQRPRPRHGGCRRAHPLTEAADFRCGLAQACSSCKSRSDAFQRHHGWRWQRLRTRPGRAVASNERQVVNEACGRASRLRPVEEIFDGSICSHFTSFMMMMMTFFFLDQVSLFCSCKVFGTSWRRPSAGANHATNLPL